MHASSQSRTKPSLRSSTPRTPVPAALKRTDRDTGDAPNFGTATELTALSTPPSAKVIPRQSPPHTLSGRTRESLRLAREKQAEQARKTPRPAKATTNNGTSSRFNANIPSSVSKTRVQAHSTFTPPAKTRPKTPVTTIRAATPSTPTSPRHALHINSSTSVTASPKLTPNPVRVTSAGSSMAVRDAIIKAKEAHQQKVKKTTPTRSRRINYNDETSFDEISNPFNVAPSTPPLQAQLRRGIENGRTTGIVSLKAH